MYSKHGETVKRLLDHSIYLMEYTELHPVSAHSSICKHRTRIVHQQEFNFS